MSSQKIWWFLNIYGLQINLGVSDKNLGVFQEIMGISDKYLLDSNEKIVLSVVKTKINIRERQFKNKKSMTDKKNIYF